MGIAINVAHIHGLGSPVFRAVLDYSKSVNPDMLNIQLSRDHDTITKSVREGRQGYFILMASRLAFVAIRCLPFMP
jgi:hypothetical protein